MYNRYIGNTGVFTRVDDVPPRASAPPRRSPAGAAPRPRAEIPPEAYNGPEAKVPFSPEIKNKSPLLGIFGGGGLNGLFDHLPFGLDTGDILLFLLLLFFYLESKDDEFLIILGIMAFSLVKEHL